MTRHAYEIADMERAARMSQHFERINEDQLTHDQIENRIIIARWMRALVLTAIVIISVYGLACADPMGAAVAYKREQLK